MDMDSTSSAVALTQVLDVPELLENILSFLPEREILTSVQLVSQTWRSSIVGSPRIQESLFLPKGKKPAVSPIRFTSDNDVSVFGWPIYDSSVAPNHLFEDCYSLHPKCRLDYIVEHFDIPGHFDFLLEKAWSHSTDYGIDVEMHPEGGPAFAHDPSLSWRKMQLCDPPITTVSFAAKSGDIFVFPSKSHTYATLFDNDGVTLGLAYDTAAAALHSFVGEDDPKIAWRFQLRFGIDSGAQLHVPEADNVSDEESTDGALASDEDSGEDGEEGEEAEEDSADHESGKDTQAKESAEPTMSKVLAIPELLDEILCFLPEREILTSVQRVSQTWRAAILDSPRIQRKLFSPKGNKPAALPAWFSTIEGPFTDTPRFDIPMYKGPMTTNDFFKQETGRDGTKEVDGLYLYKGCDLILIDWLESSQEAPERKDCYMHYSCYKLPGPQTFGGKPQPVTWDSPGLSWRSFQLCDPPLRWRTCMSKNWFRIR
jgi:hypothetical protein